MRNLKKILTITTAAAIAVSVFVQPALAAENGGRTESTASIEFVEGGTIIEPGPDPDLKGIKSGHIYFGKQKLAAGTETYSSVTSHDDEDRKHAGFIVQAGNHNGWTVSAQITGFAIGEKDTMKNFVLEMTPGEVQTISGNLGVAPVAHTVKLSGGNEKAAYGDSAIIFEAKTGEGFGKWGTNWAGALTVVGGSVAEEGSATATMLWTMNASNVEI